jgi:hypothetical protein
VGLEKEHIMADKTKIKKFVYYPEGEGWGKDRNYSSGFSIQGLTTGRVFEVKNLDTYFEFDAECYVDITPEVELEFDKTGEGETILSLSPEDLEYHLERQRVRNSAVKAMPKLIAAAKRAAGIGAPNPAPTPAG